jgi:hypothetical protein
MTVTITDLDWQDHAACRNHPKLRTNAWFPRKGKGVKAKAVCRNACPVRSQCLEWAMTVERGVDDRNRCGIAGGLSARERSQLERCRAGTCAHPEHQGGGL